MPSPHIAASVLEECWRRAAIIFKPKLVTGFVVAWLRLDKIAGNMPAPPPFDQLIKVISFFAESFHPHSKVRIVHQLTCVYSAIHAAIEDAADLLPAAEMRRKIRALFAQRYIVQGLTLGAVKG